ncbi:hypothetical protein Bca4012_032189 [Brassica carinata]
MDQQGQQSYDQYRRKLLYLNGRPKFCKPGASNEPKEISLGNPEGHTPSHSVPPTGRVVMPASSRHLEVNSNHL